MRGFVFGTAVASIIASRWRCVGARALQRVVIRIRHDDKLVLLLSSWVYAQICAENLHDEEHRRQFGDIKSKINGDEVVRVALPNRGPLSRPTLSSALLTCFKQYQRNYFAS